jgi:hypothetical protein
MRRPGGVLALLVLTFLSGASHAGTASAAETAAREAGLSSFDYFYVEANEGGSAGGHVAIRFDDHTYHFQYGSRGLLEMARTETADFLSEYALLSNRSIHVTRVETDRQTRDALERGFRTRYWRERAQLDRLARLERSASWLGPKGLQIEVTAAGYFSFDRVSPALERLRSRILERHGADALASREAAARLEAHAALLAAAPDLAERLEAGLSTLTATAILRRGASLAPRSHFGDTHPSSRLDERERTRLAGIGAGLEDRLVALFASTRDDWATPFLTGAARLLAIEASLDAGRLVFLDGFPEDAPTLHPSGARWRRIGPELLALSQRRFDEAKRQALEGEGYREADLGRLEAAANRLADMRNGVERGEPVRLAGARLLPRRAAPSVRLSGLPDHAARRALEDARERLAARLAAQSDYNVIGNNCVSALFQTVDATMAVLAGSRDAEAVRSESVRRLGGHVAPGGSLAFIPFVSSQEVRERYRTRDAFEIVSDRQARLAQMRRDEPDLWVHLRESNVLTSTIYDGGRDDSLFLFFTEDAVLMRPLYGVVNLAVGVGGSVLGVLTAPFDDGELLVAGLKGAMTSMPELFFANIRKGSSDYRLSGSERDDLPGDLAFARPEPAPTSSQGGSSRGGGAVAAPLR